MSHTASAKTSGRDVGARWLPSMSVSAVAKTWFAARRRWFRRCARARPRRDIRHPITDLFTGRENDSAGLYYQMNWGFAATTASKSDPSRTPEYFGIH